MSRKSCIFDWNSGPDGIADRPARAEAPAIAPCARLRHSRAGIGLLEVVISLFIFGICLAGMCSLAVTVREASDRSRDHYIAINLAKNRLERARSFDFAQLDLFRETQSLVNSKGDPVVDGDYRRTTVITNMNPTLKEIRVTVEIRNRDTWTYVPGVEDIRSYVSQIDEPST